MKNLLVTSFIAAMTMSFGGVEAANDVKQGSFELQMPVTGGIDYEDPICYAISRQKRLEIVTEDEQSPSENQLVFTVTRTVVEPYAYGLNPMGQPILYGNIIEDEMMKEVTVKFGEKYNENNKRQGRKGFFSRFFRSSDKNSNDDNNFVRVNDVRVLNSKFDIPEKLDDKFKKDFKHVICSVPLNSNENEK
jgi:hypothetical protein